MRRGRHSPLTAGSGPSTIACGTSPERRPVCRSAHSWAASGERAPAYYNIRGDSKENAVEDSEMAVGMGFPALKDHFVQEPGDNIEWFRAVRDAVGPDVDLMHDPVGMYTFGEAVRIGRALEELDFRWLEEPMNERAAERAAKSLRHPRHPRSQP